MFTTLFTAIFAAAAIVAARSITANRLPEGKPMPQRRRHARYAAQTAAVLCTAAAGYAFASDERLLLAVMIGFLQFGVLAMFIIANTQPRFPGDAITKLLWLQRYTLFPTAAICAAFGGWIMNFPFIDPHRGQQLFISCLGAFGAFIGALCIPLPLVWEGLKPAMADQGARLEQVREKHRKIQKKGW